jgi:hypothetical protein
LKDSVYVPPLPTTVDELQERITAAVKCVTPDVLHRVWSELDYRIDVCWVTSGVTLSVCDTTWNCISLCNCSHQICKNIPISFDFITTWNQRVFLCSLCIYFTIYLWQSCTCPLALILTEDGERQYQTQIGMFSVFNKCCLWL